MKPFTSPHGCFLYLSSVDTLKTDHINKSTSDFYNPHEDNFVSVSFIQKIK